MQNKQRVYKVIKFIAACIYKFYGTCRMSIATKLNVNSCNCIGKKKIFHSLKCFWQRFMRKIKQESNWIFRNSRPSRGIIQSEDHPHHLFTANCVNQVFPDILGGATSFVMRMIDKEVFPKCMMINFRSFYRIPNIITLLGICESGMQNAF